ncbi:AlbA family DNA-binding domain-containing protein [Ralstonia pseudosolanacearum]
MLTKLDPAALQSLIDTPARESIELDFKAAYDPENADHRRGLLDDVCALANARGGWLLLGVAETAGSATGLPGIVVGDEDAFRVRLLQMIGTGLEPRLGGVRIECVPVQGGGRVVGVHVPQSWIGPHRITSSRRFMLRGDSGNSEYDIQGLRHAFLAGDRVTRAWEAFRDDRIARFYADRLPVAVKAGPAALIHLYPLGAAGNPNAVDVYAATNAAELVLVEDADRRSLLNVDGVVRRGEEADGASVRHVQVFRSGALEAFLALDPGVGTPGLALPWVQQTAATLLPRWLPGLAQLGVTGPFQFAVTLAGVRGLRPLRDFGERAPWGEPAREETMLLPSWTIDPAGYDLDQLLAGLQQLLHQAFGRDGRDGRNSQCFGPDGAL